jgi:hypothetical protein
MTIAVTDNGVLRWTFRRAREAIVCELGLTERRSAYELRLNPPWHLQSITTERFDARRRHSERHASIEQMLIDEGWMLEEFESVVGAPLALAIDGG